MLKYLLGVGFLPKLFCCSGLCHDGRQSRYAGYAFYACAACSDRFSLQLSVLLPILRTFTRLGGIATGEDAAEFLAQLAKGAVRVDHLVTHRYPFERAVEAYELILDGKQPYVGVLLSYPAVDRPTG